MNNQDEFEHMAALLCGDGLRKQVGEKVLIAINDFVHLWGYYGPRARQLQALCQAMKDAQIRYLLKAMYHCILM